MSNAATQQLASNYLTIMFLTPNYLTIVTVKVKLLKLLICSHSNIYSQVGHSLFNKDWMNKLMAGLIQHIKCNLNKPTSYSMFNESR